MGSGKVKVQIKLTPLQAGELYMDHQMLKARAAKMEEAIKHLANACAMHGIGDLPEVDDAMEAIKNA